MQQGEASAQERANRLRQLNEGEKLSLIFTQQRRIKEFKERVEAFQCAHETGQCPLCRDKDLIIAQQQQQIEQLRNKIFGRSSERRNKGKKKNKGSRGGNGKNPQKRTRLPSEQFPDARIVECTVKDPQSPLCSDCEQPMTDTGLRETAERIEYQPAEIYIQRTHRVRYGCKCCQSAPQTAELPKRLAPGTSLGDSFIIQACVSKFYDLIPTTRYAKMLARSNAAVSHTLLLKAQSIMAAILLEVYQAIKEEILKSRVIFADETIHRQLEENGGKWRWYLWGFSNGSSVYFEIHDTRAGDVSIEFLMTSMVVLFLVSDAYSGYSRTIREINEIRQSKGLALLLSCLCNDHGRRYWFYAKSVPLAEKALDAYDKIYEIEREVQDLLTHPKYEEPENLAKALELRQTADPLFEKIYDISCEILLDGDDKSAEAAAAKYFLNNMEGLTLYLRHIELPISNAFTERSIRDYVILRKTALGNHSRVGAEDAAVQLSVMCSCKMAHVNPTEFLEFTGKRHLAGEPLLTPFQYKQYMEALKKDKPPDTPSSS
jgi:transposase